MQMRPDFQRTPSHIRLPPRAFESLRTESVDAPEAIDLFQIVRLVFRRFGVVLASVMLGVSLATLVAFYVLPSYTAKALLIVESENPDTYDVAIDTQIAMLRSQNLLEHVLESLWTEPRLRKAIPRLRDLQRHLTVMQVLKSRIVSVTFTAKSPRVAADVANRVATLYVQGIAGLLKPMSEAAERSAKRAAALNQALQRVQADLARVEKEYPQNKELATSLKNQIADLRQKIASAELNQSLAEMRAEDSRETEAVSPPIRIIALAKPPELPSSVAPILILVPAFFASSIFGVALALLLGRLDRRLYKMTDLAEAFDAPCLGCVPDASGRRPASALLPKAGSKRAHVVESMVTSLLLLKADSPKTILITSSTTREDKTNFALSFAAVASRVHRRVLLIDLDTARKVPIGPLAGTPGLFDVLAARCTRGDAIRRVPQLPLDLLPRGAYTEDPFITLSGDRWCSVLEELRATYDCIVINGPPALGVSEARILAAQAEQIILVVRARVSKCPDVKEALQLLASSAALSHGQAPIATVLTARRARALYTVPRGRRAASHAGNVCSGTKTQNTSEGPVTGSHAASLGTHSEGSADCSLERAVSSVAPDDTKASAL